MKVKNLYGLVDVYSDLDLDLDYTLRMIEEIPDGKLMTGWRDRGIPDAPMIKSTIIDAQPGDKYGWLAHVEHMNKIYDEVTDDYIQRHGIKLRSSGHDWITFNRYTGGGQMNFHSDHPIQQFHDVDCPKLSITSNLYLNDDYDGGEIEFSIGTAPNPGGRTKVEK
jgi:hypothetical protein